MKDPAWHINSQIRELKEDLEKLKNEQANVFLENIFDHHTLYVDKDHKPKEKNYIADGSPEKPFLTVDEAIKHFSDPMDSILVI